MSPEPHDDDRRRRGILVLVVILLATVVIAIVVWASRGSGAAISIPPTGVLETTADGITLWVNEFKLESRTLSGSLKIPKGRYTIPWNLLERECVIWIEYGGTEHKELHHQVMPLPDRLHFTVFFARDVAAPEEGQPITLHFQIPAKLLSRSTDLTLIQPWIQKVTK